MVIVVFIKLTTKNAKFVIFFQGDHSLCSFEAPRKSGYKPEL